MRISGEKQNLIWSDVPNMSKWNNTLAYDNSDIKGEGLVNFFCRDRHPQTDFLGRIWGDENDGKIKNIGFISIFALEIAFSDRKMKFA